MVTDRLSWANHLQLLVTKAQPKVALLRWMTYRLRLPGFVIARCYLLLVRLVLEYAASAWNGCRVEDSVYHAQSGAEGLLESLSSCRQGPKEEILRILCEPVSVF